MTKIINNIQIENLNIEYDKLNQAAKDLAKLRSEMLKTKDTNAASVLTEEFHKALQILNGFENAIEILDLSDRIKNWRWQASTFRITY